MTRFSDLPAAVIGGLGERLAASALRRDGAGVIASFKFSGEHGDEAPALEMHGERATLPDLDVSKMGRRFWLEIKTYAKPVWNQVHGCLVHGIPKRLFDHYTRVERETGSAVFLGVLQLSDGLFVVSDRPISQTTQRYACSCSGCKADARCKAGPPAMYPQLYFRRDAFTAWFKIEGDAITQLRTEHTRLIKPGHIEQRHGLKRVPVQGSLFGELPSTSRCGGRR